MVREPNWNPCWRSSSQIRKIFQTEDLTLRKTFRLKLANSRSLTTRGNCMIRHLMHQNKLQLFRSKVSSKMAYIWIYHNRDKPDTPFCRLILEVKGYHSLLNNRLLSFR
jgi:hypothetical protein